MGSCPIPIAHQSRQAALLAGNEIFTVGSCPSTSRAVRTPPTAAARHHPYSLDQRGIYQGPCAAAQPLQPLQLLQRQPALAAPAPLASSLPAGVPGRMVRRQLFGAPSRQDLSAFFTEQEQQVRCCYGGALGMQAAAEPGTASAQAAQCSWCVRCQCLAPSTSTTYIRKQPTILPAVHGSMLCPAATAATYTSTQRRITIT